VAGAEVAFFSLTYKDINMLKTKQHPAARRIISLLDQPKTLLASLLITNSFVNIGIIILSNFVIDEFVTIEAHYFWVEFLIKVIAVTFLLVLFGEILPKVWATQNNIRFAYSASLLVEVVNSVFKGFSNWLVGYADRIERGLGHGKSNVYSLEELDHAIDLSTNNDASQVAAMNNTAARHNEIIMARPTAAAPPRASSTRVEMPSKPRKLSVATDSAAKITPLLNLAGCSSGSVDR